MLSVVIALTLYCIASIVLSVIVNRKASECLTLVTFSSVAVLYLFYIFNVLRFGMYFLGLMFLLLLIAGGRKVFNADRALRFNQVKSKITPAFVVFFLGCVATYWLIRYERVNLWDELRLWGAFPKILHYTHELQMGENVFSFVSMQSYPPFMPLFIYLLTGFTADFSEAAIFWGYAIFVLSILIHLFDGLRWRHWAWIVPSTFIAILVPCVFYINGGDGAFFYRSLFIDSILGIVVGYLFFQATKPNTMGTYETVTLLLSVFVVTALKDSGAMFAVVCSILLLLRKNEPKKLRIALSALLVCLFTFFSWKIVMSVHRISESIPLQAKDGFLVLQNWKNLWLELWRKSMFYRPRIAFFPCFIVLVLWDLLMDWLLMDKEIRLGALSRGLLYISYLMFVIGYFALYPVSLASFRRYMGTLLTSYLVLLLFRLFTLALPKICKKTIIKKVIVPTKGLSVALQVVPIMLLILFNYGMNKYRMFPLDVKLAAQHGEKIVAELPAGTYSLSNPANVFLTTLTRKNDSVQLHHRIYYELIGTPAKIRNFKLFDAEKIMEQDIIHELQSGEYDYFYLASDNEEIFDFSVGKNTIERDQLYVVETGSEYLQLTETVQP